MKKIETLTASLNNLLNVYNSKISRQVSGDEELVEIGLLREKIKEELTHMMARFHGTVDYYRMIDNGVDELCELCANKSIAVVEFWEKIEDRNGQCSICGHKDIQTLLL